MENDEVSGKDGHIWFQPDGRPKYGIPEDGSSASYIRGYDPYGKPIYGNNPSPLSPIDQRIDARFNDGTNSVI